MPNPNYNLKRGDVIEYTETYQWDYTIGDPALARYGIVESVEGRYINVRTGKNSFEQITDDLICAQQWIGGFIDNPNAPYSALTLQKNAELNELLETEYLDPRFDFLDMYGEDLGDDGSI